MIMRRVGLLALVGVFVGLGSVTVRADQRRDWPLASVNWGDYAYLDYLGSGAALSIERRKPIFDGSNAYTLNASALAGQYFGQVQATASLRILLLEISGTVGYRALWRNLVFEPGDNGAYCKDCDRPGRRHSDPIYGTTRNVANYPYAEGTAALYLPFNEWMVFGSLFTARYESSPDRSFDPLYTNLHDGGLLFASETTLFFKHRDWGAFGPYLQIMSLPRAGHHEIEAAWGFNALARVGLIQRNDVFVASVLVRPGDGNYGLHWYYMPARIIVAYRMAFEL